MKKPKIGMIGLGNIARKVYLPILTKEENWQFVGAFTPNMEKGKSISEEYRINLCKSMDELMDISDVIFVHSSTSSHYKIVSRLLKNGKDVYVDKPLAATLEEAEELVRLSKINNRKLMVGFNRRFVPFYQEAIHSSKGLASVSIEKHRTSSVGPNDFQFTLLDDYLHIVDMAYWMSNGDLKLQYGKIEKNKENQLMFAQHVFESEKCGIINISMHRRAGTNDEKLSIIGDGKSIVVENMNRLEIRENNKKMIQCAGSWDTTLKIRGFEDCVKHFIECVIEDKRPIVDGVEAIKSQQFIHEIIKD